MDPEPRPRATESESLVGKSWMSVFKEAKTNCTGDSDVHPGIRTTLCLKKNHTCYWDSFYYKIYWCL